MRKMRRNLDKGHADEEGGGEEETIFRQRQALLQDGTASALRVPPRSECRGGGGGEEEMRRGRGRKEQVQAQDEQDSADRCS